MGISVSFKNVGLIAADKKRLDRSTEFTKFPMGIKTPMEIGGAFASPVKMHERMIDQITDNFRNLIMTNYGERLGRYDFGANLLPLTFEYAAKDDFDQNAMMRIKSAVDRFMPFVDLDTFESDFIKTQPPPANPSPQGMTVIKLKIKFNVPKLAEFGKIINVTLYAAG